MGKVVTFINSSKSSIANVYFIFVSLALVVLSYSIPLNSWDLLGHLGAGYSLVESDASVVHKKTYSEASKYIPASDFELLNSEPSFRQTWSTDHVSFNQLLPFYAPRILVTRLVAASDFIGVSPIPVLRLQSSIAAGLGMFLLMLAFKPKTSPSVWLLMPISALFCGVLEVARFEGADALMFLGFSLFVYLYLRNSLWCLLIIALLPITRSDAVIMSVLLGILCFIEFRSRSWLVVVSLVCACLTYLSVNAYFGNYGWAKQFYVVHIEYLEYPADVNVRISIKDYLYAILKSFRSLFYDKALIGSVIVATVFTVCFFRKFATPIGFIKNLGNNPNWKLYVLGVASIGFFILHYLAFPHVLTRYFASQYLVLQLCVLALWSADRIEIGNSNI